VSCGFRLFWLITQDFFVLSNFRRT